MKPKDLKAWMMKNGKTTVDVASAAHVDIKTVGRFLIGKTIRPAMLDAIARVIQEGPQEPITKQ